MRPLFRADGKIIRPVFASALNAPGASADSIRSPPAGMTAGLEPFEVIATRYSRADDTLQLTLRKGIA
jgi:hypothetical protein